MIKLVIGCWQFWHAIMCLPYFMIDSKQNLHFCCHFHMCKEHLVDSLSTNCVPLLQQHVFSFSMTFILRLEQIFGHLVGVLFWSSLLFCQLLESEFPLPFSLDCLLLDHACFNCRIVRACGLKLMTDWFEECNVRMKRTVLTNGHSG